MTVIVKCLVVFRFAQLTKHKISYQYPNVKKRNLRDIFICKEIFVKTSVVWHQILAKGVNLWNLWIKCNQMFKANTSY